MVKIKDKNTLVLIITICAISLFVNIYGIWWGLPMQWHPDEIVLSVKSMVANLDPNPHNFIFPSFHKYVIGIVLSPYFIYLKLTSDLVGGGICRAPFFITNIFLVSRLVSAVMGTLAVFMVYLIGKEAYNNKIGLISASFLACSMGFVSISHFATVDIPVTFWIVVSIFFFVKVIGSGKMKYYLLGGLFAGLASSTKYTALLLILPMFVSHFLYQKQKWHGDAPFNIFAKETYLTLIKILFHKNFLFGAVILMMGFIIGTPFSILDFSTFKKDMVFNLITRHGYKGFSGSDNSWVPFIFNLKIAMGLPLLLICTIGIVYLIYKIAKKERNALSKSKYTILLLSWIVPYYCIVGSWSDTPIRYIIPIIPPLTIFGGKFVYEMIISSVGLKKISVYVVFCIILIYSLGYSFAADTMFINDTRYAAGDWMEKNIDINSTIDVYGYNCYLPPFPKYVEINYPPYPDTWNQTNIEKYDNFLKEQEERKPNYIVLTSFYYGRYFSDRNAYPYRTTFFSNLIHGNTNYTITAKFDRVPSDNQILRAMGPPNPEFVNPTILILKRRSINEYAQ